MDPVMVATIAIAIGSKLAEAVQKHNAATLALARAAAHQRDPTAEEWAQLREAGAEADALLDELLR
jgi:cytochrome P450